MSVDAKILVLNGEGQILLGENFEDSPSRYHFNNGIYDSTDRQNERPLPAKPLVERLMKNVSVPSLVAAEVPSHQMGIGLRTLDPFLYVAVLVLGRDDLRPCTADDREYLAVMMQAFVPRFLASMAPTSSEYLPGDARNLCIEIANSMELIEDDFDFQTFIAMYRGRYIQKPLPQRAVVELCLLHVLKMPFELNSAIQNSLIRY
ncbi:hypothetical protein N7491_009913 [Penicillium cf. griseofulvum]|uniref:Uncharacterized protein n=1 Tax=Penicillium cf. griseofulvum TaxID=2972120 RepID=A0A9W9MYW1_9EURO|nr:hypothetical protein N7472_000239 [Penicillium cf. griseofulvum]KAJ5421468.1 hypothetical protein N7491_009913 [Penicillium cf. griseofulvum]KAJ5424699.1 hypothetical protein N7445_010672 [Penicillium cf. griseofulvum]